MSRRRIFDMGAGLARARSLFVGGLFGPVYGVDPGQRDETIATRWGVFRLVTVDEGQATGLWIPPGPEDAGAGTHTSLARVLAREADRALLAGFDPAGPGSFTTFTNRPAPTSLTADVLRAAWRDLHAPAPRWILPEPDRVTILPPHYGAAVARFEATLRNLLLAAFTVPRHLIASETDRWYLVGQNDPGDEPAETGPGALDGYEDLIETLVDLARDDRRQDFDDLARASGVPADRLGALWSGTRRRLGRPEPDVDTAAG